MTKPLVFQHGVATKAFDLAVGVWVVFEVVMSVRQAVRLGRRPARDPSGWILGPCMFGSVFAAINLGRHEVWLWPGGRLWPVIVGLVMIAAGIALRAWSIATLALASGSVLGFLVAAALLSVGLAVRIHAEEKQLIEQLGDQYQDYAASRKRVVPGLW